MIKKKKNQRCKIQTQKLFKKYTKLQIKKIKNIYIYIYKNEAKPSV